MRHESVTLPRAKRIDWKGIGYLFSIAGALMLGAHAWPKPSQSWWHFAAVVLGVATTIMGFGVRYLAHLKQRREIEEAKHRSGQD